MSRPIIDAYSLFRAPSFSSSRFHSISASDNRFKGILKVDIQGDTVEVPTILDGMIINDTTTHLAVPLIIGNSEVQKTGYKYFSKLMSLHSPQLTLHNVVNSTGIRSYGTRGLVLNENLDILFMTTIIKQRVGPRMVHSVNAYIHPDVISGPNNFVNKMFTKYVIPDLSVISFTINGYSGIPPTYVKPTIIIANKSNMIVRPARPDSNFSDARINGVLEGNINEVTELVTAL
jgi:hypothetical protein